MAKSHKLYYTIFIWDSLLNFLLFFGQFGLCGILPEDHLETTQLSPMLDLQNQELLSRWGQVHLNAKARMLGILEKCCIL